MTLLYKLLALFILGIFPICFAITAIIYSVINAVVIVFVYLFKGKIYVLSTKWLSTNFDNYLSLIEYLNKKGK